MQIPSTVSSPTPEATQTAVRASAELLRWRADILMDEMMLGAADLSASDRRFGALPAETSALPNGQSVSGERERYADRLASYTADVTSPSNAALVPPSPATGSVDTPPGIASEVKTSNTETSTTATGAASTPASAASSESPQLLAADRRYRMPQNNVSSNNVSSPYASPVRSSAAPAVSTSPSLPPIERQYAPPGAESPAATPPTPELGPVRVTHSARFANSMTVGARANQYSTLLPRSAPMDVRAIQLELATLTDQVEVKLPPGHDVHVRARHLLEKAREILASGSDRGVEIEYYLQQVRAIVERASQRIVASAVYYSRLVRYMLAWAALALVAVAGLAIYQPLLVNRLAERTTLAADGLVVRNVTALLITLALGVLGGALGALVNMRRHGRKQYGFFDRKYSTLGLILPIIGLIVGLVIYLLCIPFFMFFRLDPLTNPLLVTFPAALAFLFGYFQENIYGTNE